MPIQEQNIVFVASQVMDDVPEGGGAATGRVIEDGKMNNVFEDISDLDRAYGRFNLRKLFLAVRTLSTDLYGGAKTVITALPQDDALGYTLFSSGDPFDTRSQAANRVEAYLYKGPMWRGYLHENHIAGMRAISIIMPVGEAVPPVGKTLCLVQDEGLPTAREQYVRVARVTVRESIFSDGASDFVRQVVTLDLSDALRHDFAGFAVVRSDANLNYTGKTRVRDTSIADATRYYGAQRTIAAASIGDRVIRAASQFTRLVPSAQTERPVVDQSYTSGYTNVLATAPRRVEVSSAPLSRAIKVWPETRALNYTTILKPRPAPGTLRVVYRAQGNRYELRDDGAGSVVGSGNGTVDYVTGSVLATLQALPDAGSAVVLYWGPNAAYNNRAGTIAFTPPVFPIKLDHDGVVRGSVVLTWQSGGVAVSVSDSGGGALGGSGGSGYISYSLGELYLTPTAMPDPQSEITVSYRWAETVEEAFPGLSPDPSGIVAMTLADAPVPGSISLRWSASRWRTSSDGQSTDEASTIKDFQSASYAWGLNRWEVILATQKGEVAKKTAAQTSDTQTTITKTVSDDGAGGFDGFMGTVLYEAGTINIKVVDDYFEETIRSNYEKSKFFEEKFSDLFNGVGTTTENSVDEAQKGGEYVTDQRRETYAANSMTVRYRTGSAAEISVTQVVDVPLPSIMLTPYTKEVIVPGSVRFTWMGSSYEDYEGVLYRDRTDTTLGIPSGDLDYSSGAAVMYDYVTAGSPHAITIDSLWTRRGLADPIAALAFNTELAPVRPTGITLSVVDALGHQLVAAADVDGRFDSDHIYGAIDYETGLVQLQFGDFVLDSALTEAEKAEWWYDPADVITEGAREGMVWRPRPVMPETIRYNAIAYSYLPLDADILGIDPVRLPSDGRVPIYRAGDVVMVMHTAETAPQTVAAGDTIDCGRTRIGWVRVIDATGASQPGGYTLDRATGIVTITDVSGMVMPIRVRHTVGDLRQITDAQINGTLTLARPLTHDYPAGESIVASCLIHGDRRARVSAVWDQATWGGTWSDSLVGSEATATLDVIAHPIEVTNEGAETERWLLRWTSTTNVELIGERRGLVYSGPFTADIAPINPRTRNPDGTGGVPYLRIPVAANGGGWSTGNVVRINTVGALADIWIARSIQQSDEPLGDGEDGVELYALGNIDRP